MCTKKDLILETASTLFSSYGTLHLTMDDIANDCGISKKTIYNHFQNKADLIDQIIDVKTIEINNKLKNVRANSENAISELNLFFDIVYNFISKFSPTLYRDLKRNNITLSIRYNKIKQNVLIPFIKNNIKRGIKEKMYKKEIVIEEMTNSLIDTISTVFTESLFEKQTTKINTYDFFRNLFIYRLVNIEGFKHINNHTRSH